MQKDIFRFFSVLIVLIVLIVSMTCLYGTTALGADKTLVLYLTFDEGSGKKQLISPNISMMLS